MQSLVQLISIYFLPFAALLFTSFSATEKANASSTNDAAATAVVLRQLGGQLGLTRRIIRTFRFLDAFASAHTLYMSSTVAPLPLTSWLDLAGFSFNGMYLFLEAISTIDVLNIPGLAVWGPEYTQILKIESQRSWFFALLLNGLACVLRLNQMRMERQLIPAPGHPPKDTDQKPTQEIKKDQVSKDEKASNAEKAAKLGQLNGKIRTAGRKLAASALDLLLPGSVIGWTPVGPGIVASAMSVTSLLTGYEVWKKVNKPV